MTRKDKGFLISKVILYSLFLSILISIWGCAPKKVKVYHDEVSDIRREIVEMAVQHIGRPYKSGAKGPDAFDCSGFVHYVYKRFQISLPPMTDGQIKVSYEIPQEAVLPGDLVFFRIKKDFHVGIMINKREFVHASKSRGVAVDDVESAYWRKNLLCFRRAI